MASSEHTQPKDGLNGPVVLKSASIKRSGFSFFLLSTAVFEISILWDKM